MFDCEPAPFLLGFILGSMFEEYLRRAMLIADGDPLQIVTRPISGLFLAAAAGLLLMLVMPAVRRVRGVAFQEG